MTAMFLRFTFRLSIGAILVLSIHLFILSQQDLPLWDHFLLPSYGFNTAITLIFFWVLLYSSRNKNTYLGWIFLLTSALKFFFFFFLIYPLFTIDGEVQKIEFYTFFLPYSWCLVSEIHQLSKILNRDS